MNSSIGDTQTLSSGQMTLSSAARATPAWQPFHEPFQVTLARTFGIALVVGAALAFWWGGPSRWVTRWSVASLVMLWASLGGHWVELWYLNWLRPRLSSRRDVQVAARLATWFVGGIGLALCMWLTATALAGRPRTLRVPWWAAGFAFIGLELVVHGVLQLRARPNFFNGRG